MSNQIVDGVVDIIVDHVSKRYLFKMFSNEAENGGTGVGQRRCKALHFFLYWNCTVRQRLCIY